LRLISSESHGSLEYPVIIYLFIHHRASGLYETSLNSKISLQEAEEMILTYLKSNGVSSKQLIAAGKSTQI
jgi:oligoribonuclease (3'-5' exoribonuclease)